VEALYTWVIWQFPRRKKEAFCGAVRPTIAGHSWFPALIQPDRRHVHVYGHLSKQFTTPEAAAKHLESLVESGE
jgi:hypothetical protein